MIQRLGLVLLTLPVAAFASLAPVNAQYYSSPPPGYVRVPPPGGYYDRAPGPAFWSDDDDDDQPVRGHRVQQYSQDQAGAPSRILPYPNEAEAASPQPPAFAQQPAAPPPPTIPMSFVHRGRSVQRPVLRLPRPRHRPPAPPRCRLMSSPSRASPRNWRPISSGSSSTTRPRNQPARSSSIPRIPISIWCSATARLCATAYASAARSLPGPAPNASPG